MRDEDIIRGGIRRREIDESGVAGTDSTDASILRDGLNDWTHATDIADELIDDACGGRGHLDAVGTADIHRGTSS